MSPNGGRPTRRTFFFITTTLLLGSLLILWQLFVGKSAQHSVVVHPSQNTALNKTIIVGALASEDVRWTKDELPGWNQVVYIVDTDEAHITTPHSVPRNKGNEANVYLWYIIQHYDSLPDVMVFLHSHRDGEVRAWHVDNEQHSNPLLVQRLRVDSVLESGFVNLRCIQIPGCPDGLHIVYGRPIPPKHETSDVMPSALQAMFPQGFDSAIMGKDKGVFRDGVLYPTMLAAPCCAQFAVSKEQVLKRPREDYERYHRWVMDTTLDNYTSGRVMEYLWHIFFGKDTVWCPGQNECNCRNYDIGCH